MKRVIVVSSRQLSQKKSALPSPEVKGRERIFES